MAGPLPSNFVREFGRTARVGALGLSLLLLVAACSRDEGAAKPPRTQPVGTQELALGALLPLTGPEKNVGIATQSLLETRIDELNAELKQHTPSYSVSLRTVDTKSDPAVAQTALDDLADDGVWVFIGPESDAELKAVNETAQERNVLVLSPGSSATVLSESDNLLRLFPDDTVQAAAIVDMARKGVIETLVPVSRDDPANDGLVAVVESSFEELGGLVTAGVSYDPSARDLPRTVAELSQAVAKALEVVGPGNEATVAVLLASMNESRQLLTLAAADPVLARVRWLAGDGVAKQTNLGDDPVVVDFANRVSLRAARFGLDPAEAARRAPLSAATITATGIDPDVVAYSGYDALDLVVRSAVDLGFPTEPTGRDLDELRARVLRTSLDFVGVTGPMKLNDLGDRATGIFDFSALCPVATDGAPWRAVMVWEPGPDGLTGGQLTGTNAC